MFINTFDIILLLIAHWVAIRTLRLDLHIRLNVYSIKVKVVECY